MGARMIYTFLLLAVGLFAALLLAFILKKRGRFGGALVFCLLLAAGALYTFAYAAELWSGASLKGLLVCSRVEYLGISFIPSLWFLFCLDYTGTGRSRFRRALPLICGSLLFLAVCSMPLHNLYYVNPSIDRGGDFPFLRFERGPLYWAGQLYQWAYVVAGDLVLLRFLKSAPSASSASTSSTSCPSRASASSRPSRTGSSSSIPPAISSTRTPRPGACSRGSSSAGGPSSPRR